MGALAVHLSVKPLRNYVKTCSQKCQERTAVNGTYLRRLNIDGRSGPAPQRRSYNVTNIATTAAPITTVASQPNQRNRVPMVKRPITR